MTQDEATRFHEMSVRVIDLERKLEFVLNHLQLKYYDPGAPDPAMQAVVEWLKKGNQIEAIKAYRLATNAGLAEAKNAVEEIGKQNGIPFLSQANNKRF